MSPCGQDGESGIFENPSDESGQGGLTLPEAQIKSALKKLIGGIQKGDTDAEKACKKLDADGKDDISEREFNDWIEKQPFDQRVKDEKVLAALWTKFFLDKEKQHFTIADCQKHLK